MNYLWGGLILISIIFAIGGDAYDMYSDTYQNSQTYQLEMLNTPSEPVDNQVLDVRLVPSNIYLTTRYRTDGERSQLLVSYADILPQQWLHRFGDNKEQALVLDISQLNPTSFQATVPAIVWPRLERMMQAGFDMAEFAAKLALGLARGKKLYDKRAAIKKKDTDRDMERTMARYK